MLNPGSNLLAIALRYINPSAVQIQPYAGRTLTPDRRYVPTYGPAVPAQASFQPLDRKAVIDNGLELEREYANVYVVGDVRSVEPGGAPDRVLYNGGIWTPVGKAGWTREDGWARALCVREPA